MASALRITKTETIPATIRVDERIMITSSLGTHRVSRFVLIKVHTDEGIVGIGEATVTPEWSGETQGGACFVLDHYLEPVVVGEDPFDTAHIMRKLDEAAFGNHFSKAAIEMALFDIMGKALGVPVYRLLGGRCRDQRIPIKFVVAAVEPDVVVRNAEQMVASGFDTIKIKVGADTLRPKDLEGDVERVRRVREALGSGIKLTVDANGGWTVPDAIRTIRRLERYDIAIVEQPVARDDLDGMAKVRAAVEVPIMADESVFSVRDALEVIKHDAADLISVYPGKNGGILNAKRIAEMAQAAGIACHIGSNLEWDVASSAMAHLAVSTPNIRSEQYPADILGPLYHLDRVVKEPMKIGNGFAEMSEGTGLGVALDEEKIERLRDKWAMRNAQ